MTKEVISIGVDAPLSTAASLMLSRKVRVRCGQGGVWRRQVMGHARRGFGSGPGCPCACTTLHRSRRATLRSIASVHAPAHGLPAYGSLPLAPAMASACTAACHGP